MDTTSRSARLAMIICNVVLQRFKQSNVYESQWKCEADLDNKYRFGAVTVACEGYEHPDDPYILRGMVQSSLPIAHLRFVS